MSNYKSLKYPYRELIAVAVIYLGLAAFLIVNSSNKNKVAHSINSFQLIPDANKDGHPELNIYLQDGTTKTIYSDNAGRFLMPNAFGSKLEANLKPEATQGLEGK